MNNLFYAGVVAFGAFTLLIEARRNYSVSAKHHPFEFYPILKQVKAEHLCSKREWRYGFYIYSSLYLLSYGILLSFSELYEIVRDADLSNYMVGSTNTIIQPDQDPLSLADTSYGKPIFISAFIIAFYSLGATRNIELHIRTLAHRIAGVPRGVLTIIHRIQHPKFLGTTRPPTGPLMENLQEAIKNIGYDAGKTLELPDPPTAEAAAASRPADTVVTGAVGKEQYLVTIARALRTIDCLYPSVTGGQRATHFPLLGLEELTLLSKELDDEIKNLRDEIDALDKVDTRSLVNLQELAISTANSTRAVFAVYYIGNSRTILNVERNSALDRVKTFADRGYRVELNAFAAATIFSFIIALFVGFANYHFFRAAEISSSTARMEAEYNDAIAAIDPEIRTYFGQCAKTDGQEITSLSDAERENCTQLDARYSAYDACAGDNSETPACKAARKSALLYQKCTVPAGPDGFTNDEKQKCEDATERARKTHLSNNLRAFTYFSFWDAFATLAAVVAVAQLAIFERDIRKEQHTWHRWSIANMPYVRLFTSSILPPLAGVVALTTAFFLKLAWDMDFQLTSARIETLILDNWQFFMASIAPFFVLSLSCYVLMDKHDDWPGTLTFIVSIFAAVIFALVNWFVVKLTSYSPAQPPGYWLTGEWRDTIQLSLVPAVFLAIFALVLELTEHADRRRERKLIEDSMNSARFASSRKGESG